MIADFEISKIRLRLRSLAELLNVVLIVKIDAVVSGKKVRGGGLKAPSVALWEIPQSKRG